MERLRVLYAEDIPYTMRSIGVGRGTRTLICQYGYTTLTIVNCRVDSLPVGLVAPDTEEEARATAELLQYEQLSPKVAAAAKAEAWKRDHTIDPLLQDDL